MARSGKNATGHFQARTKAKNIKIKLSTQCYFIVFRQYC